VVAAIATGLTGVTYQHLDMVHYRSVVWLPFALTAAIRFARGTGGRGTFALFVFAHVAALTAGALQEVFVSSLAIACVFAFELVAASAERREKLRRLIRMAVAAVSSTCIGLVSIVPYLKARALGDIFTAAGADRATQGLAPDGMATLLVPHVNGFYPYMYGADPGTWFTDFSTTGTLFVLIAIAIACLAPAKTAGFPRRVVWCVIALTLIALLKVQHVAILDFMSSIPLVSEIRFVKYHFFLFVLFALLIAAGLEAIARMDEARRKRVVLASSAALALLLLPIALLFLSAHWVVPDNMPAPVRVEARWSYSGSALALAISTVLLYRMPRHAFAWLALTMLALAVAVRPNGWLQRTPAYQVPVEYTDNEAVRELHPARTIDANWDRGVSRKDLAGFHVGEAARLAVLQPGSRLRFEKSGERRVKKVEGDRVWVDGALLDPEGDGAPHAVELLDPKPVERQRIASLLGANINAACGFETPWVFDPVNNKRLRELLADRFTLCNPWFHLQAAYDAEKGFTPEQLDWLRFLGVTRIYGYEVASKEGLKRLGDSVWEVEHALPRVFPLRREAARTIRDRFPSVPIRETLDALRAEIAQVPAVTDVRVGARGVTFRVARDFEGALVATQAFSHGWLLEGATPQPFCALYPIWDVKLEAGRDYTLLYRPPGLTLAFAVGAFGLVLALVAFVRFMRVPIVPSA
jgi:hypothetical protein